jgi:hypothetical protein
MAKHQAKEAAATHADDNCFIFQSGTPFPPDNFPDNLKLRRYLQRLQLQ